MSAVAVRIGLGFVVCAAIFQAIQAQVVMNALVLFVAAGIIPGTDIALSPDATILTVIVILLGIVVLLNRRRLMLGLRHPHMRLEGNRPVLAVRMSAFSMLHPDARPRRLVRVFRAARSTVRSGLHALGVANDTLGWLVITSFIIIRQHSIIALKYLDRFAIVWAGWLDRASLLLGNLWHDRKLIVTIWLYKARTLVDRFDRWLSE